MNFFTDFEQHKQAQPPFVLRRTTLGDFLKTNLRIQRSYWSTEYDTELSSFSDFSRIVFSDNSKYSREPEYLVVHFAGIIADIRKNFKKGWAPSAISFKGKLPGCRQLQKSLSIYSGARLVADSDFNGLMFPKSDLPMTFGKKLTSDDASRYEVDGQIAPSFIEQVGDYLSGVEKIRTASITQTAAYFTMHPKGLQRRLREFGLTFKDLQTAEFIKRSSHLLLQLGQSNESIAEQTGLSEGSAFSRAFFRYSEIRPSQFRK